MRKTLEYAVRILFGICLCLLSVILIHYGRRIFIADSFRIPSSSMSPTLNPGDRVLVNKLLFGPRIYTGFDFSRDAPLRCLRLPGIRDVRPGDVIVFNFPFGYDDWSRIEFRINYVFCKRVAGCPGDRIGITDGHCWNSRIPGSIGIPERQDALESTPDSIFIRNNCLTAIPLSRPYWSIKNMGPLSVPAKGDYVKLTPFTASLYRHIIEYETGLSLICGADGDILLDGRRILEYKFTRNWYFALGDNSPDSNDSRYWGFIPEDFIIGIVSGLSLRTQ